jgi:hypothetical protein
MPRTLPIGPALAELRRQQDGVLSTLQLADHGWHRSAAHRRCRDGRWQWLLPGVLLTLSGTPTRRQRVIAAHLWAGPLSAVDGLDACRWYGLTFDGAPTGLVHVVVPNASGIRSNGQVVVRRALAEIVIGDRGIVPYVDVATALIVAARHARTDRSAVAMLSRGLQRGVVTVNDLRDARERIGDKWCRGVDAALVAVGVGLRSPAERDTYKLIRLSKILPEPAWNQGLRLDDGGPDVCVDALWEDAGMVNEVIGKRYHAWGVQYDDTNARKERLQAAGFVVCEVTPARLRREGRVVLANLERVYAANAGRGLPTGVTLVDPPTIAR